MGDGSWQYNSPVCGVGRGAGGGISWSGPDIVQSYFSPSSSLDLERENGDDGDEDEWWSDSDEPTAVDMRPDWPLTPSLSSPDLGDITTTAATGDLPKSKTNPKDTQSSQLSVPGIQLQLPSFQLTLPSIPSVSPIALTSPPAAYESPDLSAGDLSAPHHDSASTLGSFPATPRTPNTPRTDEHPSSSRTQIVDGDDDGVAADCRPCGLGLYPDQREKSLFQADNDDNKLENGKEEGQYYNGMDTEDGGNNSSSMSYVPDDFMFTARATPVQLYSPPHKPKLIYISSPETSFVTAATPEDDEEPYSSHITDQDSVGYTDASDIHNSFPSPGHNRGLFSSLSTHAQQDGRALQAAGAVLRRRRRTPIQRQTNPAKFVDEHEGIERQENGQRENEGTQGPSPRDDALMTLDHNSTRSLPRPPAVPLKPKSIPVSVYDLPPVSSMPAHSINGHRRDEPMSPLPRRQATDLLAPVPADPHIPVDGPDHQHQPAPVPSREPAPSLPRRANSSASRAPSRTGSMKMKQTARRQVERPATLVSRIPETRRGNGGAGAKSACHRLQSNAPSSSKLGFASTSGGDRRSLRRSAWISGLMEQSVQRRTGQHHCLV